MNKIETNMADDASGAHKARPGINANSRFFGAAEGDTTAALNAVDILGTILQSCSELKLSFHRDRTVKAVRLVCKPSVETSTGFQKEVLKALISLQTDRA